jgi:iron complex transport system ATP-binding protein
VTATPILSAHHIHFRYTAGGPPILHDVSVAFRAGTITALLGPNGSGKTTLLSILLGIRDPDEGVVRLDGRRRESLRRGELSRAIGLVPQEELFPMGLSVLDFVLLGRAPYLKLLQHPRAEDYAIAADALDRVGLMALRERSVSSLSGGERQLATVARALAQCPRVLLMDEPTSHLDLGNRHRVRDVVRQEVQEGMTVIMTTHDPNEAAGLAHHAVLMCRGQVVAEGPAAAVLTADHLTAIYGVDVQVGSLDGRLVVLES